jgi:hypothetical protein
VFTSLATTFSTTMTRQRHEVILYAGYHNDAECAEHVESSVVGCTRHHSRDNPATGGWSFPA